MINEMTEPRFRIYARRGFGLGLLIERWPHAIGINLMLGPVIMYIGLGKCKSLEAYLSK
jgi:hypothetical protein